MYTLVTSRCRLGGQGERRTTHC